MNSQKSCCGGHKPAPATEEVAIDPICGMTVTVSPEALQLSYKGKQYYFCCGGCRRKFNFAPERYLAGKPASRAVARKAAQYTCPMHPEVQSPGPGDCPDCGMPLEPTIATASSDNSEETEVGRRLRISALFTVPLFILAMSQMLGMGTEPMQGASHLVSCWLQFALATPVVLWASLPFLRRGWNSLISRSFNMFTLLSLGIAIPYIYSIVLLVASTITGSGGAQGHMVYFESAGVITTLAWLGQYLELRARTQSTSAVRQLVELVPDSASVILADGSEQQVPVADLVDGCHIRIRPGNRIPADGVLLEGQSDIDESSLTGESLPVKKEIGDQIRAGTLNQTGSFVMRAEKVGQETVLGQIVELVGAAQRSRVPVQQFADRVAAIFVPVVAAVAVAAFIGWLLSGAGLIVAITTATAVFVIACPCALGLATPMSIVVATGRAAQAGVLFKDASAIQSIGQVDTVVLDKTGTLTQGKPVFVSFHDVACDTISENELLTLAASTAFGSEHPLSRAIVAEASRRGLELVPATSFTSVAGGGTQAVVGGRSVSVGNARYLRSLGVTVDSEPDFTCAHVCVDNELAGTMRFADKVKDSAASAVRALQDSGIRVILASGDSSEAAITVGGALGIDDARGRMSPLDKAALVAELKAAGRRVAMIGDGINDAPALAGADVGIAMSDGTSIAIDAADVVLLHGDLSGLIKARIVSMAMMSNIRQNLLIAFAYNLLSVPLAAGLLLPLAGLFLNPMVAAAAMSLSSVAVICNALRLRRLSL